MGSVKFAKYKGYEILVDNNDTNFIAFTDKKLLGQISGHVETVGIETFIPLKMYRKFGSTLKTSAGYTSVNITDPKKCLMFIGRWKDFLLFRIVIEETGECPFKKDKAVLEWNKKYGIYDMFVTYQVIDENSLLFYSYAWSGRIIECQSDKDRTRRKYKYKRKMEYKNG
jgi:hypothetical protein